MKIRVLEIMKYSNLLKQSSTLQSHGLSELEVALKIINGILTLIGHLNLLRL